MSVYPVIAAVLKTTDRLLEDFRPRQGSGGERFLKRWRQVVSFITVSRLLGRYNFSVVELSKLDIETYTYEEVKTTWDFICLRCSDDIKAKNLKKKRYYVVLCQEAAEEFSISGISRVEKINNFSASGPATADRYRAEKVIVDLEFAKKVDGILPPQPWKPGIHIKITKELGCSNKEYFQSVQILIDEGIRNKQLDGVVYDDEGNVIAFDPERVDPDTFELLDS